MTTAMTGDCRGPANPRHLSPFDTLDVETTLDALAARRAFDCTMTPSTMTLRYRCSATRVLKFVGLLVASWTVMAFTHEMGHIIGGCCCGGTLVAADLRPWHLPYSFFNPDPHPLITLWSGPLLGVAVPLAFAFSLHRDWGWFVAYFCLLANGTYISAGWLAPSDLLDTTRLLNHGAHSITILLYCLMTMIPGYLGFRRYCIRFFARQKSAAGCPGESDTGNTST